MAPSYRMESVSNNNKNIRGVEYSTKQNVRNVKKNY